MLFMKKEYFGPIRSGRKTTTLRFWRGQLVRPGSDHTVRGLGKVHIDAVHQLELSDLTEEHARADGFDSLAALRQTLDEYYPPEKRNGRKLYQVHFTFLG